MEEKILSSILNNLKDGLIIFDSSKTVVFINGAFEKFFDVKKEKILGKKISDFFELERLKYLYFLLGENLQEVSKRELEFENLVLEVNSFWAKLNENQEEFFVVSTRDITREKSAQRLKSEFLSVSAHQLRTPLTSLKWSLENLFGEKMGRLEPLQKEVLKKALESLERISILVQELLNLSAIEEGKFVIKKEKVNIEEVLKKGIEPFDPQIKEKQIQFEMEISQKLPSLKGDSEKLKLAFQNLIDNAIKYSLKGKRVLVKVCVLKDALEFQIQDEGIGIPEKEKEYIFEKFFRASNAIKQNPEGSGLGLFFAKKIIEAHQGKIWFESEEGKGTTFFVLLPLKN